MSSIDFSIKYLMSRLKALQCTEFHSVCCHEYMLKVCPFKCIISNHESLSSLVLVQFKLSDRVTWIRTELREKQGAGAFPFLTAQVPFLCLEELGLPGRMGHIPYL